MKENILGKTNLKNDNAEKEQSGKEKSEQDNSEQMLFWKKQNLKKGPINKSDLAVNKSDLAINKSDLAVNTVQMTTRGDKVRRTSYIPGCSR